MRHIVVVSMALLVAGCGKEAVSRGKPISHWRETLKGQDARVRQEAVEALGELGPEGTEVVP
ncbi:MAG TPA: hypothetical protein VEL76_01675, partial [Gemmataceae bacterium]|nr:hypothetical protein [Gemmataceae bacterium]